MRKKVGTTRVHSQHKAARGVDSHRHDNLRLMKTNLVSIENVSYVLKSPYENLFFGFKFNYNVQYMYRWHLLEG